MALRAKRQPYRRPEPVVFRVRPLVAALARAGIARITLPRGAQTYRDATGRLYVVVNA
jgi:hypothetical protein